MRKVEFEPYIFSDNAEIYVIRIDNDPYSEFKKFFVRFNSSDDWFLKDDLARIVKAVEKIVTHGALEPFFRVEGGMSDRVCAIPLEISSRSKRKGTLRVYCIRVSDKLLLLDGGVCKKTQTYQEDVELFDKVKCLQVIDKRLRLLEREGMDIHSEIVNIKLEFN